MSITKTQLVVAFALVLSGATYLGVTQHQQISTLQAQNQALAAQAASAAKRAQDLAGKLESSAKSLASARSQLAAAQSGSGAGGSGNSMKVVHLRDVLRVHPEYSALERVEIRHSTLRSYERALEALKLSPDQAAQVRELLVARDLAGHDAHLVAEEDGIADGSPELGKVFAQAEAPANQALDALIGADDRGKLEALKGTSFSSSNDIDDLAVELMGADQGLAADQVVTLAQMEHNLEDASKNPSAAVPGYRDVDPATWESPLDQDFFTQAAALLTPNQLQVVKTYRAEENQARAIMKEFTGNGAAMIME